MNGDGEDLEQLLHPLRSGPIALSGPEEIAEERARLLPLLQEQVRAVPARARRRRIVRRIGGGALAGIAAAACFALGRGLFTPPALPGMGAAEQAALEPEALRVEPLGEGELTFIDAAGQERALLSEASLRATGELVSGAGSEARVSTADGVQVKLAPATRVRVSARVPGAARPPLHLVAGEINCRVPPLGRTDSFSIMTPSAQVIVHGTVFTVRVSDDVQARTCVQVERGLVEVRHPGGTTYLGTDSRWGCDPVPVAAPPVDARAFEASSAAARARGHARKPTGTLAQEIELLSAALSAEQKQDLPRARTLFAELLGRYPYSPLAPEARAGLARSR